MDTQLLNQVGSSISSQVTQPRNIDSILKAQLSDVPKVSQANNEASSIAQSPEKLEHLMESINDMLKANNSFMQFSKDDSSGRLVYKLYETESNDLIKQFPSESFLAVSARLKAYLEQPQQTPPEPGVLISHSV